MAARYVSGFHPRSQNLNQSFRHHHSPTNFVTVLQQTGAGCRVWYQLKLALSLDRLTIALSFVSNPADVPPPFHSKAVIDPFYQTFFSFKYDMMVDLHPVIAY